MKNFFLNSPISPDFILNSIYKHQIKHNIGAHNIFLGQVRKDTIKSNVVSAIEYSAYEEMANKKITDIALNEYLYTHLIELDFIS